MSHHLSQPEEIELALMEQDEFDVGFAPLAIAISSGTSRRETLSGGYVPPYRAAYVRSASSRPAGPDQPVSQRAGS